MRDDRTYINEPYMKQSRHDDGRMTREEAKEILTHNWTRVDNPNYSESELDEAFFMAIEALSADAEPKWNCTANFVAEQLDRLRNMTDEEKWEFFKRFFEMKGGAE